MNHTHILSALLLSCAAASALAEAPAAPMATPAA